MKKEDLKMVKEIIIDMSGVVDVISFKSESGYMMNSFKVPPSKTMDIVSKILKDAEEISKKGEKE